MIDKITSIVEIKDKSVLEIGPGTGNLTLAILKKNPKNFLVIEKDNELVNLLKKEFKDKIEIINNDVLKVDENFLNKEPLTVFGNLPYNISTEILCKWILNIDDQKHWFDCLILMFQKEVANRIISEFNTRHYGRLSIIANWKLNIKKICDVKPSCFSPKPKVESSILLFKPKSDFFKLKESKNLEMITRTFFSHRRKMIKKPFNQLFNKNLDLASKLNINLNLRPQNLDFKTYYQLTNEFEKLRS